MANLPDPVDVDPAYGAAHCRPILAFTRPVGRFEVDLTTFREGMPVSCMYVVDGVRVGWYTCIVSRIDGQHADIEYDDGEFEERVPFKRLRMRGKKRKLTFDVAALPLPKAIVLSLPHAREAVEEAERVIEAARRHALCALCDQYDSDDSPPKADTSDRESTNASTGSCKDEAVAMRSREATTLWKS